MSSQLKLATLALISTAAAVPHYGHHSRFHKPSGAYGTGSPSGAPYPTGGWGGAYNSSLLPTGTGVYPDSQTTTILETLYSTATVVSTIYATKSGYGGAANSVGVADVSTGPALCGPATVYVTATNKVTVTVPAGGIPSSVAYTPSSVAEAISSTSAYEAVPASSAPPSSVGEERYSFPHKPVEEASTAAVAPSSSADIYSILPVSSAAPSKSPVHTSSAAPTPTPSEAPVSSAAPEYSAPASSAAPAPSSPAYSGGKRGLAYNDAGLCNSLAGKFSFAYNWASVENNKLPDGIQFIPTMHKPADATPEVWLANVDKAVKNGAKAVFGFNEPDIAAQANLTPEEACTQWTNYMEPIKTAHPDVSIVGPSVSNGGAPLGLDWLDRFQKACPSATWHAANIHFYDVYDDNTVQRFKDHVEQAAKQFNKPCWVTEFGLNPGSATAEQAATFLKAVIEYMDGSDSVQGYSYFMVGDGENQLNGSNGVSQVYSS